MSNPIYIGNDNQIEIADLRNSSTGAFINDATVTVTLKDSSDSNVAGQTWPTTMSYVTSSNGVYRATLDDGLSLTENAKYTAEISISGDSLTALFSIAMTAVKRRQ